MSTPTPVPLDALARILIDIAVRQFLKNSNPALVQGRAQAIVNISAALEQLDTGNSAGATSLATAVAGVLGASQQSDPGLYDALLTFANVIEGTIAPLVNTAVGAIVETVNVAILAQAATVAQTYLTAPASKPAVKDIRKALDPAASQVSLRRTETDAEVAGQAPAQA